MMSLARAPFNLASLGSDTRLARAFKWLANATRRRQPTNATKLSRVCRLEQWQVVAVCRLGTRDSRLATVDEIDP